MTGLTQSADSIFDSIDGERLQRARELAELKHLFAQPQADLHGVKSKAVVVLCYAHWEGFYNSCAQAYIQFLLNTNIKVSSLEWMLILGVIDEHLQQLWDRNHSTIAKVDFIERLGEAINSKFDKFSTNIVEARSSLDFEKLRLNYRILSFDIARFQRWRNKIDKELVGWRHAVAHGSSPNLTSMDATEHVDFTNHMLLELADQFQEEILRRL
jgi:hypothetical protein